MDQHNGSEPSRRDAIANSVLAVAGVLGISGLAARFFQYLYPVIPPEHVVEVAAAKRDAIPANGGLVVILPVGPIALVDVGGEVRAFSAVCTHLGCVVRWEKGMDHFFCPCHKGMFNKDGNVVGGPPPRPLKRYPVETRDGQVVVKVTTRPPTVSA